MNKMSEIISQVDDINAMPGITLDIMGLLNERGTTIMDLTKKIKTDEALAAFILKNCNSPLYGIKSEITSILQALTLLGFATIKTILMSYFNKNLYSLSGKNEIKKKLWHHSISVASFSQSIASQINLNQEESYLSGLLHDIGKLIIYKSDNELFENVLEDIALSGQESYVAETKAFGFNHSEIGALIMKKWQFADVLSEVSQFHHSGLHYDNKNPYIGVVAFANLISHKEIKNETVDVSYFINKYKLSEKKIEKIISTGLDLYNGYIAF